MRWLSLWASARAVCVLAVVLASGCSSPTSPTPSPGTPPGQTPSPPTALSITCPVNQSATATSGSSVAVTFAQPVAAGGVAPVQVSCTRTSGSMFPVGTTPVQCTASDAANSTRSCTFNVIVAAPAPQLTRTTFLAFGDSTTSGEVTVNAVGRDEGNYRLIVIPAASYPSQLLSLLRARYTTQASALVMTNAGAPTEWAEDGALRLPGVLAANRPQAVLLLEGVNDVAALGTRGVQNAWRAIDTMAKEIRNRGARAFIATLPPPRATGVKAVPVALIQSLNANIRDTARGEGAVLVDVFQALNTDVTRYIGTDGLHPTEAGYQKIAETFYEAIRLDLERR
jgi:lysophospholipase L1-like esterase